MCIRDSPDELLERGRGDPLTRSVPGIIGEVAQRQDASPSLEGEPRRAVHGEEVEEDGVTGLHLGGPDVEGVAVGLDVRQLVEGALGEPLGFAVEEGARQGRRCVVEQVAARAAASLVVGATVVIDGGTDALLDPRR